MRPGPREHARPREGGQLGPKEHAQRREIICEQPRPKEHAWLRDSKDWTVPEEHRQTDQERRPGPRKHTRPEEAEKAKVTTENSRERGKNSRTQHGVNTELPDIVRGSF